MANVISSLSSDGHGIFPSLFHMAVKYATHLWKLQQQMENGQILEEK